MYKISGADLAIEKFRAMNRPHVNRSTHADPRSYYCAESKEIIEQFYKEDFEYFNYPIEDF